MRILMKIQKIAYPDGNTRTVYEAGKIYLIPDELVPKMFLPAQYEAVGEADTKMAAGPSENKAAGGLEAKTGHAPEWQGQPSDAGASDPPAAEPQPKRKWAGRGKG